MKKKTPIYQTLLSQEDRSVNFIFPGKTPGMFEARYVRREDEKLIVYLSSQQGCKQACRFCHLTQTGQLEDKDAELYQYLDQADAVLKYYDSTVSQGGPQASRVNFNFMARGEPLSNELFRRRTSELFGHISEKAWMRGITPKFNISTIMPKDAMDLWAEIFLKKLPQHHQIYYSMYSVRHHFRSRWIPRAMNIKNSLDTLKRWQDINDEVLVFHHAFIENENDSVEDVEAFLETISPYQFNAKFNCVRYNPYSDKQGKESPEEVIQRNFDLISKEMTAPGSRIVPRVGFDVKASCGCFIEHTGKYTK